jgi:hypothetical protein
MGLKLVARCGGAMLHGEDEMRPKKEETPEHAEMVRPQGSTRKKKKNEKVLDKMIGGVHILYGSTDDVY